MTAAVNQSLCPLCQQNNLCGVNDTAPCWCVNSNITQDLLAKVPEELSRKSCICQQCIDKYNMLKIKNLS